MSIMTVISFARKRARARTRTHTHTHTHTQRNNKFSAYSSKRASMGRDHCKSLTAMSRTLTMCCVKIEQTRGLLPPFTKWTAETISEGKRQKCYDIGVFPNLLFLRGACCRICGPPNNSRIFFVRPLCAGNRNSSARDITLSVGDFYDKLSIHISFNLEPTVLTTTLRDAVTALLSA